MTDFRNVKIKICCISSIKEAALAVSYGADALGFVSKMPSGPGVISDEKIIEIIKTVPPSTDKFLLTSETQSDKIIEQQKKFGPDTLQLVDEVNTEVYNDLKKELPGIRIVQVVHVRDEDSIGYSERISKFVDAILLDSGNPDLSIKELGGTGKVHDWNLSRKICETVNIPVYLAGGLNSGNVQEAIRTVRPYAVDLCSGVRTDGKLDESKLKNFINAVRDI
ncbi:MAG TPA: phosphoribosylanthranilate isomerase [Ignavibacteria bacterium]|nr:phosphoribosylanthranilate isomerase [Ignavibacteria bacterium]HMR40613.1 phosphoribosylanthranilate isomerase [Ignavibacteria bacterium]